MDAATVRYLRELALEEDLGSESATGSNAAESEDHAARSTRWWSAPVSIAGRPLRVLVADQDPLSRWEIACRLRVEGYSVIEAETGTDMLEEISLRMFAGDPVPVDLVISSESLQGPAGRPAVLELRDASWPTPYIIVTDLRASSENRRALHFGAAAVFLRPVQVEVLVDAIPAIFGGFGTVIAAQ